MVVLGGLGSVTGSVIAAVVLTVALEALREFQSYRMVVYAFLLVVLMLARPQGLFGTRELWDCRSSAGCRARARSRRLRAARRRRTSATRTAGEGAREREPARARARRRALRGLKALSDFNLALRPGELVGSSARTARGRRPRSTPSPASTRRRRARCGWTAPS